MTSSDAREQAQEATRLKLYVAGDSARTRRAVDNLRRVLDSGVSDPCELEVVDVLRNPEIAERERVLATPMLLRESPPPRRRLIGDLSDVRQLLALLANRRARPTATPSGWNGSTPRHTR